MKASNLFLLFGMLLLGAALWLYGVGGAALFALAWLTGAAFELAIQREKGRVGRSPQ